MLGERTELARQLVGRGVRVSVALRPLDVAVEEVRGEREEFLAVVGEREVHVVAGRLSLSGGYGVAPWGMGCR